MRSPAYQGSSDVSKMVLRRELDWLCQQAGGLPFARLGVQHIEALMMKKQGPAAQNKVKKNLSLLLNFAIKKPMGITFNPAKYADKAKENPDGFYTWTAQDCASFMDHWEKGTKPRLAFELIRWAGASRQDAIRLGRQNIKSGRIQFSRGKTKVHADLPVHPDLARELAFVPSGQMLILTHSGGKPYKPSTFGNWFKDQCVAAGVLKGSAHGLRKWLATELANAGRSPDEIRAVLAHKTNAEGQTYTKKADRARLADSGFDGLSEMESEQKLSNLPVRLDKKNGN